MIRAAEAAKRAFADAVGTEGLTSQQARAIFFLQQPRAMTELAEHLRCDASNITGIADRLSRAGWVTRVPGEDRLTFARRAVVRTVQEGDVICREREQGGALHLLISGANRLTVRGSEVAELAANDVFGEQSIFDQEPRATTATVLHDSELLRVSADDFHEAVRENVEIAEAVIRVLNRRLRDVDRRLAEARRTSGSPPPAEPEASKRQADADAREGWIDGVE